MSPLTVAAILVAVVLASTGLGIAWRLTTGRARAARGTEDRVTLPEVPLGERATLLQFSTEVCAPCVPTRRVLSAIADETDGVQHVDLDLTHRPDLASRFRVLQTPTTLVLDGSGTVRARIGGAPRPSDVRTALEGVLA